MSLGAQEEVRLECLTIHKTVREANVKIKSLHTPTRRADDSTNIPASVPSEKNLAMEQSLELFRAAKSGEVSGLVLELAVTHSSTERTLEVLLSIVLL